MAPRATLSISVAAVLQVPWNKTLHGAGTIVPWQEAVVSARSSGLAVVSVLADVGTRVRKGDVLARLDDRSARSDVAQASASLAEAAASERQSHANRDRTVALRGVQAVSEQDILQAITNADTDAARRESAAAALISARVRLENTVVTAPDDGTVTSRTATLGQVSTAGTELFRLLRQNRLEWHAEIPTQQVGVARALQSAMVTLPDGSTVRGSVRLVAPALDSTSHLALVYVQLQADERVKSGMVVSGRIDLGEVPAMTVPAPCVVIRDGRSYVFRVEGHRVRQTLVVPGRTNGDLVEIVRGLEPGQIVALRGAGFLADDDVVAVVDPKGSARP